MKTKNFLIVALIIIGATMILTSCYKDKKNYNNMTNTGSGNGYMVSISDSGFSPANLSVVAGSQVTWKNNGTMIHAVSSADGIISSGDIAAGSSFSKTFPAAGTFNYSDAHNSSMTGAITVNNSSGGGY